MNYFFTWKLFFHNPMVGKNLSRRLKEEKLQCTHQEQPVHCILYRKMKKKPHLTNCAVMQPVFLLSSSVISGLLLQRRCWPWWKRRVNHHCSFCALLVCAPEKCREWPRPKAAALRAKSDTCTRKIQRAICQHSNWAKEILISGISVYRTQS